MRDFKALVREQVASLALAPARERKIVEEWAAQIEDVYEALLADGLSDADAWNELQRQVPEWTALSRELIDAEPVITRLARHDHGPLAGERKRRLVFVLVDLRDLRRPRVCGRPTNA